MRFFELTVKETDVDRCLQPKKYRTVKTNIAIPTELIKENNYNFVCEALKQGLEQICELIISNKEEHWRNVRKHTYDLCKGCEYLNNKNKCILEKEEPTAECVETYFVAKRRKSNG